MAPADNKLAEQQIIIRTAARESLGGIPTRVPYPSRFAAMLAQDIIASERGVAAWSTDDDPPTCLAARDAITGSVVSMRASSPRKPFRRQCCERGRD